jgi:hypothetical protein
MMGFVKHFLTLGEKVGYINTELTTTEFVNRLAAIDNGMPLKQVEKNPEISREFLGKYQEQLLYAGIDDLDNIIEKNMVSWPKTVTRIEEFVRKGMRVLIVDNLTTYSISQNQKKQGWEILAASIASLINIAKEHKIVVLMVIHLRPNIVQVENATTIKKILDQGTPEKIFEDSITRIRRPSVSDVYGGGGALSQISGAIFVWRPFQKHAGIPALTKMSMLILESFRHVDSAVQIRATFDGEYGVFKPIGFTAPF